MPRRRRHGPPIPPIALVIPSALGRSRLPIPPVPDIPPRRERPRVPQRVGRGIALLAAGVAGALIAYLLDPANGRRRRHLIRDRALAAGRRRARRTVRRADYTAGHLRGAAHRAHAAVEHQPRDYDDVTLARKVETEIFRPVDAPKGEVDVNVHDGVVELRGQVAQPEQIAALGDAAACVEGVARVENLLHTPGFPPKHAPISDPAEVRARAIRIRRR